MNCTAIARAVAACVVLSPGLASAQAYPPGTPVSLDRRVFIDVNQAAPSKILDVLADKIACTLDVDRRLPQPDITLRLSNVRARTALDAVCDMVGCRWKLVGRTLRVEATTPPPPVPPGVQFMARLKTPLSGARWRLDRVPLRDVLAWLSQETGAQWLCEGPDQSTPISLDLTGRTPMDAFMRVQMALGWNVTGGTFQGLDDGHGPPVIRLTGRRDTEPRPAPVAVPVLVHEKGETGLTMPMLLTQVRPHYTRAAMDAKIQGKVVVSCVVGIDGSVGDVTVFESLDPGLDDEAVKAARQWRFTPGTKDGKPVPVRITLELTFTLR